MARFVALINGLPRRPTEPTPSAGGQKDLSKFYLTTKEQPLEIKFVLDDAQLGSVDTCFEMFLYLDPGTEIELLLDESQSPSEQRHRLLEHIGREPVGVSSGQWKEFSRCISDYMPRYAPAPMLSGGENSMKLLLKPNNVRADHLVALQTDPSGKTFATRKLYPIPQFAPDIKRMLPPELDRYWIIERDGATKAHYELVPARANETDGAQLAPTGAQTNKLTITNIDPSHEYFDITSRWMQIKDIELIEQPILFEYHASNLDWVDQVEFQFQRSGDPADKWITQQAYTAPSNLIQPPAAGPEGADNKTQSPAPASGNKAQKGPEPGGESPTAGDATGANSESNSTGAKVDIPIRLRGLDSEYFRLRLRHKPKRTVRLVDMHGSSSITDLALASATKRLDISSLAFADACSYWKQDYCKNGGVCEPSGPATAQCFCAPGYSGPLCEYVRPCEAIQSASTGTTGRELCKSIGAKCLEKMPVFRCQWPNDEYLQCKTLFKPVPGKDITSSNWMLTPEFAKLANSSGQQGAKSETPEGQDVPLDSLPPAEQVIKLNEVVNQQAKLIIIMAVFMIAIVIFAIVLIGSMIGRLSKSKSRLERSQSELHEMSRRFSPGTSAGNIFGGGGGGGARSANLKAGAQAKSPGVTAYNNSAFDVE